MSNVQPSYHTYNKSLQQAGEMMQTMASSPASSLDSTTFLLSNPHSAQFTAAHRAPTSSPARQNSVGTIGSQLPSLEHAPSSLASMDGAMDSPQESKSAIDYQSRDAFSDISASGFMPPAAERHRKASSTKKPRPQKRGSLDDSEVQSSTSSKGVGAAHQSQEEQGSGNNEGNTEGEAGDDDAKKPVWSEMKTKAGKERKRLPLACIACRRKKIRCSGEKPACKHCVRSRIPCVYKVTTRKAAPRTDYMTMLDKRLKRMEDRVIRIIPDPDPEKMASIGRASVKPPTQQAPKSAGAKKRAADEAFTHDIEEWSNSRDAADYIRAPHGADDKGENGLLKDGIEHLPSKEIQEHLAETFFDYVYGQSYHLLHKPSFMRRLKSGNAPPVLTLAVCAISARFSPHPEVNTEPAFLRGEQWAKPARDIALKRYDEPNITTLIVLLILGLHEFGTCQGGRSWMLGGMAMRMAHALQLHRELDHDPLGRKKDKSSELSFTDREIRRRTMWACFLMDRFNSSGTERPMMVHEDNIEVQLPIKESNFRMELPGPTESLGGKVLTSVSPGAGQAAEPDQNMGVAAYVVRSIAIWGKVIRYLNLGGKSRDEHPMWDSRSQYADIKRQTEEFAERLPAKLRFSMENLQNYAAEKLANQFLFLHLVHYQTLLFLHRFSIPTIPGTKRPADLPAEFTKKSARVAIDSATKISEILSHSQTHMVTAPFAGYCAFVSGTIHVWGIFSKLPAIEASSKRHLASNVKYLSTMKKYWGIFYHIADNLRSIYQQNANASQRGVAADSDSSKETGVFEYGNWFNTYPHGVSRTDYQEPAASDEGSPGNESALGQKSDLQTVQEFFKTFSPPTSAQRKIRKPNGTLAHLSSQPQPPAHNLKIETGASVQSHHPHRTSSRHHDPNAPLVTLNHRPSTTSQLEQLDLSSITQQHIFNPHQSPFTPTHPHQHQHASHHAHTSHPHSHHVAHHTPTDPSPAHSHFDPSGYPPNMPFPMQEIDRQFVFDAYATDPNSGNMGMMNGGMGGLMWDFGMEGVDVSSPLSGPGMGAAAGGGAGRGMSGGGGRGGGHISAGGMAGGGAAAMGADGYEDVSSAWFMPFNLAPPDVGHGRDFGFGR